MDVTVANLEEIRSELASAIDGAVSVVVARRTSDADLDAAKLALAQDAADAFRDLARQCLDDLDGRLAVQYTADAELGRGEAFIVDDPADLAELADLSNLAGQAATLAVTPPRDLDLRIQFYGVVLGDDARLILIRRTDPQIAYRGGRWLAIAGERLTKLEEPAFSFSPGFDLILHARWTLILNQGAFERLFREIGLIDKHIRSWVRGITDHLPMDSSSADELVRVAHGDSRLWRRLREIQRRGHLARVELADVRKYARRVGLDPNAIIRNGQLVFDASERFSFLHLLNEDLYRGPLTDETFEAQRKAATGTS
jgi:Domain of unknown function (DUF4868)